MALLLSVCLKSACDCDMKKKIDKISEKIKTGTFWCPLIQVLLKTFCKTLPQKGVTESVTGS